MKKIIFLDFDGVLNTEHYQNYLMYQRLPWQDKHGAFFDPEAVRQQKKIVDAYLKANYPDEFKQALEKYSD